MSGRGRILLIDDDPDLIAAVGDWLAVSGFEVETTRDPREAEELIAATDPETVVTDIRMPGRDGMALLTAVVAADPDLPVVLITGHGDVPLAVRAMREGAEDFIEKPYDADHLVNILDRAVAKRRMAQEIERLRRRVDGSGHAAADAIVGDSPAARSLRQQVTTLAGIDIDVLIIGETGTGKELVARALHEGGPRAKGPFVAINCAAVPESIFESEVFGHVRGAFTGAQADRQGKLEFADGGTVFFDEIESMPLSLQVKILRALQERQIERLGDNRPRPVDIRVVAAVKTDLSAEIAEGSFREDLYYRLAGAEIDIPPLRARAGDIPLLFSHFTGLAAQRHGRTLPPIREADFARLMSLPWPGNVRELKAEAERFALGIHDWRNRDRGAAEDGGTLPERLRAYEKAQIVAAMEAEGWRSAEAARRLGIPRRTLNEKLARYRLRPANGLRD